MGRAKAAEDHHGWGLPLCQPPTQAASSEARKAHRHPSSLECFCWARGGGWLGGRPERGRGEGGGESPPALVAPGSGGEITPPSSSGQKSALPSPPAAPPPPSPGNTTSREEGRGGGSCPLPRSRPRFRKLPRYPSPGGPPPSVASASGSSSADVGPRSAGPQGKRRRQNGKRKKESSLFRGPSGSWSVAADSRPQGSMSPTQGPGLAEKEDLPPAGAPRTRVLGGGWVRVGRPGGAARGGDQLRGQEGTERGWGGSGSRGHRTPKLSHRAGPGDPRESAQQVLGTGRGRVGPSLPPTMRKRGGGPQHLLRGAAKCRAARGPRAEGSPSGLPGDPLSFLGVSTQASPNVCLTPPLKWNQQFPSGGAVERARGGAGRPPSRLRTEQAGAGRTSPEKVPSGGVPGRQGAGSSGE